MSNKKKIYSADFETTTDLNDCRVWAWATCEINDKQISQNKLNLEYGNDIESFILYLKKLKDKSDVYFHNLAFDGEFIISYLLNNGFKHDQDLLDVNTFSTVISSMQVFYCITIIFDNGKRINIYDSLKKLPFKVSVIAKAFELEETKLTIDYREKREKGHELTDKEKEYVFADVIIVAKALNEQFNNGLKKMTIGSDALKSFKSEYDRYGFLDLFPKLSSFYDKDIRKAYRGGFTWCNPRFQNKRLGPGLVYDVNSLYPYVMYDRLLPIGLPVYFDGEYNIKFKDKYPLYIQHFVADFKLKKNHIPIIQLKNNVLYSATEYIKSSDGEVDLYLTNVDLDLFFTNYDVVSIKYLDGYMFEGKREIFKNYIDKWMTIKKTTTGGKRQLAKLMLNSLYGKFGTSTDCTGKKPYLNEDGGVKYKLMDEETRDPVYTPMACFITAYAREITIKTALSVIDRFAYCDTDSIHILGNEEPHINIHPVNLGAWKLESTFVKAKFIRAKTYLEVNENGKCDVKCAGLPDYLHSQVTFENFRKGKVFKGKLRPCHVPGGIVLVDSDYKIR